ncbi:MAG TPA: hypothetical protein VN947_32865 [Polyangia bacterium]|nr:hypothetical protein [Polyangia bacterium]
MKLIPAVFFQKRVNGVDAEVKVPERLEMFDSELREVVGGLSIGGNPIGGGGGIVIGGGDGSGGHTTYSYSAGWLDVLQPDDSTY